MLTMNFILVGPKWITCTRQDPSRSQI